MQEAIINQELANLDLNKVTAIQQKRTLAFVNHFVITTVEFLNNFMKQCEHKLMQFERKIEKVEAAMVLLEARLSSIPEANAAVGDNKIEEPVKIEPPSTLPPESKEENITSTEEPENNTNTTPTSPEYDRFIKMVQVGVPLQAVKLKVSIEGLDPNILEKLVKK